MAFVNELEQYKDKLELLIFRAKGFSAHHKENGIISSTTTTGYDRITPEIVQKCKDLKIPLIDASNMDYKSGKLDRLLIQMPMVSSENQRKFEFPFSGMSYAPAEIVASLYERMGAQIHNVQSVNLVPEMFRSMRQKETLMLSGFFSNNEDQVKDAMIMEDSSTHQLPGGDKLKGTGIAEIWSSLEENFQAISNEYSEGELERRNTPFSIRNEGKDKNPRFKELLQKTIVFEKSISHIDHMVSKAGYEASLVIAGEKTDKEAVSEVKAWCKNKITATLEKYKEDGLINSEGKHKYYFDALKEAKKVSDKIQKEHGLDQGLSR